MTWTVREPDFTIYKRIFAEYLTGESCLGIAKRLNLERIPPPGGAGTAPPLDGSTPRCGATRTFTPCSRIARPAVS